MDLVKNEHKTMLNNQVLKLLKEYNLLLSSHFRIVSSKLSQIICFTQTLIHTYVYPILVRLFMNSRPDPISNYLSVHGSKKYVKWYIPIMLFVQCYPIMDFSIKFIFLWLLTFILICYLFASLLWSLFGSQFL